MIRIIYLLNLLIFFAYFHSTSASKPPLVEKRCPELYDYEGMFIITYDNDRKLNSAARFTCKDNTKTLEGPRMKTCLDTGKWTESFQYCVQYCADEIRCPVLDDYEEFIIEYDNDRQVNSVARYACKNNTKKLEGTGIRTCLRTGEWSESLPNCGGSTNCSVFPYSTSLQISYSKGVSVNSIATFRCAPNHILMGKSYSICERNGTWSNPLPSCLGAVLGCVLERDPFSILRIEPVKETYRFGESIELFCPLRRQLSPAVNRIMCLGTKWSDSLPDCV